MTSVAIRRFEADLILLQLSVERAGSALGCNYATSEEFEAAVVDARRKAGAFSVHSRSADVLLTATAGASLAALLLLVL